jgi:hypothetical protein
MNVIVWFLNKFKKTAERHISTFLINYANYYDLCNFLNLSQDVFYFEIMGASFFDVIKQNGHAFI